MSLSLAAGNFLYLCTALPLPGGSSSLFVEKEVLVQVQPVALYV